jgi:ferritin-like metal-binding protein YciE
MAEARESLAAWLRDAHAMEGQAITLLETQIDRLESYPEAIPRLKQHLAETRDQQAKVERCLQALGEDTSTLKDAAMKVGANLQGMMHMMSSDEVLTRSPATRSSISRPLLTVRWLRRPRTRERRTLRARAKRS